MNSLQIGYVALNVVMVIITICIAWTAIKRTFTSPEKRKSKIIKVTLGLLAWQVYIYLVATSGFIQNFDFPPRFALCLIIPLFIFTALFLRANRKNDWIVNIPESWLIYFQSFRLIVETLFVMSISAGVLNKIVTIEGYNYDMILGGSALLIGLLVYTLKLAPRRLALIWNYLGIAILASVIVLFFTSIYSPEMYGPETQQLPMESTTYPYVLVAGFLMPLAVFFHVLSIMQLSRSPSAPV